MPGDSNPNSPLHGVEFPIIKDFAAVLIAIFQFIFPGCRLRCQAKQPKTTAITDIETFARTVPGFTPFLGTVSCPPVKNQTGDPG